MKLIFINRYFYPDYSATSQLLTDLTFYMANNGWQVEVLTSRQLYDDAGSVMASSELANNVQIKRVWTTRFGRTSLVGRAIDYFTFYVSTFVRLLIDTRPDDVLIAKTDPPLISVIAAAVAAIRSAKLVNWVQDLFPEVAAALHIRGMGGGFAKALKNLRNWSLKRSVVIVVLGDRMKRRLIDEIGNAEKIRVIHNWSDGTKIQPVARLDNPIVKEWLLEDKFVVGYSGNMGQAHEFGAIVDAAESLRDHAGIVFLFIGGGARKDWIKREAQNRGLSNIIFKPYQPREDLSYSLGAIDLHLITLNKELEGLIVPSKFYGVAAAGRPILFIGDREGEIAQILEEEKCGVSVNPEDVSAMVEYILALRYSREYWESQGGNARRAFVKRFSFNHAQVLWESTIQSVADA